MQPVLIVEGVEHRKISIEWNENGIESVSYLDKDGKFQQFYDVRSPIGDSNRLDLQRAINWEGRYNPVLNLLYKRIEAHEEVLLDLSIEHMRLAINKEGLPFVDIELEKLEKQHEIIERQVDGLHEALGIITQDVFMQEDVDLSGGEEIAESSTS